MIAGVDEAGRGPVLGPLAIAGVCIKEEDIPKLMAIGVKDSKLLSPKKRETLAVQIKEIVHEYSIVLLSPAEIDVVVESKIKNHKLNRLEAKTMAKVIETLKPDVVYVDAADRVEKRFGEHIAECLSFSPKIVSEHKADLKYPVVSAASILAKVERDKKISELKNSYGNIGCGYPNDKNTVAFLKQCILESGDYPEFVRKSWQTAKRIKNETTTTQKKLQ
ncbi:MAG: ribonuclease HII [Candidatus Bathyarchaeia archaeon]